MTKIKFAGELKKIKPNSIINRDKNDDFENFFLVLGVVFNDLKGIFLFESMIRKFYIKPGNDELSTHSGNYFGFYVQIEKLFAGIVREFLLFLKENSSITSTHEFRFLLEKTPSSTKNLWNELINIANDEQLKTSKLINILIKIRNNVAFHYHQSGKNLRQGFISFFFDEKKIKQNEWAYYSIGNSLEETRFYYSDASVEKYLEIITSDKGNSSINSFTKYQSELMEIIKKINSAITFLLKVYLKSRPN